MTAPFLTIGNYQLLEELAGGAFGRVYRARHFYLTNRIAAVKLLHTYISSEKERQSFLKEASFLEMLKHPHILPIFDVGIHENIPYIITEFADGQSLRQILQRLAPKLLPLDVVIRIVAQVAEALQFAHQQQVVHRDLKPENILFRANGSALLADFGISTILSSMSVQQATITGTPPYMAPEQFKGAVSKESDQYALGCIAYELVTGHRPFSAPDFFSMGFKHVNERPQPPMYFNSNLPEHISQAILKALAKGRQQRYPEVIAFARALTDSTITSKMASLTIQYSDQALAEGSLVMPTPSSVERYMETGDRLFDQKQYEEALKAYEEALRFDPRYVAAYNEKGNTLLSLNRFEEALKAYEEEIRLDPKYVYGHNGKGLALKGLGRYAEALREYEDAIKVDPRYVSTYLNKGDALLYLKRYEEALKAYEEAIQLDRRYVAAYNAKGITLEVLGRYEEALATYEKVIQLDPGYVSAYRNKGDVLQELKQYEKALRAYEEAIQLDQGYVAAYNGKGNTLQALSRYKEALEVYEEAIRLKPTYVHAYNNKGNALFSLKRYKEALESYEKALRLDPSHAHAYSNKKLVLQALG